jgi:nitroimidazol reductase NimA-like FMN-containing flavoprotein (pyridoxamine 5'-phosphate oxidase superfamily)
MPGSERPLHDLTRKECLELLQYHSFVGRLGFVLDGRPQVLPVNYLADEQAVVFCTAEGTVLGSVAEASEVVFEVDESHPLERSGWSVVVRGPAEAVTDPEEVEALRRGPLRSWAVREPQRWVRITIHEVTGRRLGQRQP